MPSRAIPKKEFDLFITKAKWLEVYQGKDGLIRYITPAGNLVDTYHTSIDSEVESELGKSLVTEEVVEVRKAG